ncbi:uncharacterized protein LOC107263264 [Cephus cinctus]|uniref:Uncharacterized protein LOC107263264 n=1 Tax=Cephus cinctus TaxID=211228 RepID=A0AAJ7R8U2_CEPCN|nr:uncharacterized protein LOC107263264 [Cephus cinctus]XP_024936388.1 uncharacterized protein LOC107263264 [Cephus cinctus]
MKFIVVFACVSLALAAPSKKHIQEQEEAAYEYEYGNEPAESHYVDSSSAASHKHHGGHGQVGYSAGGGLVSIAQGAADQAHTAIANQHSAAAQAAYMAKNTLGQSAAQSAATAAAALAGKQIIVLGLEQQSRDAHVAVDGEKMQLQQAQRAATAAQNTAQQAMHQVQVITAALNAAQATADHAAQAAAEAAAELAAQTTMVGQAKARAETIDEQLAAARIDFEATQIAANKAAAAAQTAQNNAAAAAAHAASAAAAAAAGHHPASLHQAPLSGDSFDYQGYHY